MQMETQLLEFMARRKQGALLYSLAAIVTMYMVCIFTFSEDQHQTINIVFGCIAVCWGMFYAYVLYTYTSWLNKVKDLVRYLARTRARSRAVAARPPTAEETSPQIHNPLS